MSSQQKPFSPVPQDLHIHTTFSTGDSAVVPEQTVELIARIGHAETIGISDHIELCIDKFEDYSRQVKASGLRLGVEVTDSKWVPEAVQLELEYYVYHCWDREEDYRLLDTLLAAGKPVIVAHPYALGTDLRRIPRECFVEINNRYIWRSDWRDLSRFTGSFRFVISSDAHQPNWLNQNVARHVAAQLGIQETLLFSSVS